MLCCGRFATAVAMLLVLSACSPLVNRPGKRVQEPKIENGHFVAVDGALLPVRVWPPTVAPVKAVVVALHGFNDYSNFFTVPGRYLSSRGIASYAYDQRGFGGAPGRGLWAGTEAYADDLSSFVAEVRKRHPGVPLYLLGESMGGGGDDCCLDREQSARSGRGYSCGAGGLGTGNHALVSTVAACRHFAHGSLDGTDGQGAENPSIRQS